MARKKKILIIAYKIERGKGSEDAAGYQAVLGLIRRGFDITLVSRKNNIALLREDPAFRAVGLVGVDVPRALAFYKKRGRGVVPYYYLWQIFVAARIGKIRREKAFDVIHQLNFHTDWAPHFIRPGGEMIVWGPIYHGQTPPFDAIGARRARTALKLLLRGIAKGVFWHLDPFMRRAVAASDRILYGNRNVAPPFRGARERIRYINVCGLDPSFRGEKKGGGPFTVLSVGRLTPIKCFNLTIDAFARFLADAGYPSDARLVIIGRGELGGALERQVADLKIGAHVTFLDWMDRGELVEHYHAASLFLFPSFEPQGLVVSEAMASGTPVVAIGGTGPDFLAGDGELAVAPGPCDRMVRGMAERLAMVHADFRRGEPYRRRAERARRRCETFLTSESVLDRIVRLYNHG